MMNKKKSRYSEIRNLFTNYRPNKSRLELIENGLISDEDFLLGAIDYSKDKIQTSNLSSLDDIAIRREEEVERLKKDVSKAEILYKGLRKENDRKTIKYYFFDGLTGTEVAYHLNVTEQAIYKAVEAIIRKIVKDVYGGK